MLIREFIYQEQSKPYFAKLRSTLMQEYASHIIYPAKDKLFLTFTLPTEVKVVVIGQDPYINEGQAHGIAFSVEKAKITPTLTNIFKELESDLHIKRDNCNLSDWVAQGVVLFNAIFTVRARKSLSHKNIGWEEFSSNLVRFLDDKYPDVIFVLWGNYAKSYKQYIKNGYIIESTHPSPLSAHRGFFGSKPFSKINQKLQELNKSTIQWASNK